MWCAWARDVRRWGNWKWKLIYKSDSLDHVWAELRGKVPYGSGTSRLVLSVDQGEPGRDSTITDAEVRGEERGVADG